ncbi:asparagine synthase (glutamine-hydrolyzing) [Streptomyces sp. NPDC017940]|uniref:asparagine synthase (glutamine-hydrolyzing) n=1 Tax=Streptomyces sp. NPDC017940 TaxID=3365017 RepID=UPI0037BCC122
MCGITGWIAYDQDLDGGRQRAALAAMTATMDCRGPDAGGEWVSRRAALGHRRLAVIDLPGGSQPMSVSENGRIRAVITFSGEIYNYRALRSELSGLGHRFSTASDTEVVLHAYLQWGPDLATRLDGMFAMSLWDTRTEELLLIRDRLGIKPLYYCQVGDALLFASEPKALLAHPDVTASVDAGGLRELLSLAKTPGHAVYRGMCEVRPGHINTFSRRGLATSRYWALQASEHTDDLATTIATVRGLLENAIAQQSHADVPLGTLLSGGLDSSALTALAARASDAPVRSFSVAFDNQARDFTPDLMHVDCDEPFVRALAEHVNTDHTDITVATDGLMNAGNRRAALTARDLPSGLGDFDISALLLFRAVRRHLTVALSGEGADELFGGYFWFHDPNTVNADTFPWRAAIDVYAQAGFGDAPMSTRLLNPDLVRALDLPAHRHESYRQALADVPHIEHADPVEQRMREAVHLHLTRFLPLLLDRKDRMSMATGLEVRVPFCDHRLVQYVFNTPWSMKTFDGQEKSLLRAAVADLLPDAVRTRPKNPYPTIQDPQYTTTLRTTLAAVADDYTAPVHDLLDTTAIKEALAPATDPKDMRYAAELVLDLDTWLRQYPVRLDLP